MDMVELRKLLNDAVISDNLHSPDILEISTRLDRAIVEFYSKNTKKQDKKLVSFD